MYTRQPRSSDDVVAYSVPVLSFISPDVLLAEVLTGSIQTHFRCIIRLGHSTVVVENSRVSLKGLGLCCTRGDWALMATPLHSRASCAFVVPTVSGGKLREGGRIVTTVCAPRRSTTSLKLCCSFDESNVSSPPSTVDLAPPTIDLEIVGPEAGGEATRTSVGSGEKLLRNIILENKLELYGLYGKVMNCGGGGSCGTCVVEILEGQELLNERTDTEYKYLKKKPESWRLSCQTIVGDKSNSGKVVVQRLPQKKK